MNKTCLCLILGLALILPAAPRAWATTADKTTKTKKQETKVPAKKPAKAKIKKAPEKPEGANGGFGGLAWGSSPDSLPGLVLQEDHGPSKYYILPGGDMSVRGVQMRELVYIFCHGAFAGVLGRFDGDITRLELLGKLKDELGEPLESPANFLGDRSWRFVDKGSVVMLEFSTTANTGAVASFSSEVFVPCAQDGPQAPASGAQ